MKCRHHWAVVAQDFNQALGRQRQANLCEFKASLVYRVSSRTASTAQKKPVSTDPPPKKIKLGKPDPRTYQVGQTKSMTSS